MIEIRKSTDRGRSHFDWLESRHSFSFAHYFDRKNMGFGPLRVINEDWIAAGRGFGPHPHRDMEILTYVLEGELAHRDGEGHESTVAPGRAQLMRAGTGIVHSEMNASHVDPVHLYQVWIEPSERALAPHYAELEFEFVSGEPIAIATPHGERGGLAIHQDASLHALRLEAGQRHVLTIEPYRGAWVQVAAGSGEVGGITVEAGDGVAVRNEASLAFGSQADSEMEVLIFDLP